MEWMFIWAGLSVAVGMFANSKGRNGLGWGMLSLLFSPLIIGLMLLALTTGKDDKKRIMVGGELVTESTHDRCPACKQFARRDATVCPHCRSELTPH